MYSTKYAVSIHILSLIALSKDKSITSEYIAGSVNTNPALVRRLMSDLKQSGLIRSQTRIGITGLGKPPEEISLLEIFQSVEKEQRLFSIHEDTNSHCPVGARIGSVLEKVNGNLQVSFQEQLAQLHLSDVLKGLAEES